VFRIKVFWTVLGDSSAGVKAVRFIPWIMINLSGEKYNGEHGNLVLLF